MDDLFITIGRLYVDVVQAQKILESFQKKLQEKDKEIQELSKKLSQDASYSDNDTQR